MASFGQRSLVRQVEREARKEAISDGKILTPCDGPKDALATFKRLRMICEGEPTMRMTSPPQDRVHGVLMWWSEDLPDGA